MRKQEELGIVFGAMLGMVMVTAFILTFFSPCVQRRGSKGIGVFLFVLLGLQITSSILNFYFLMPLPLFVYLNFTIFAYWLSFIKPNTRPLIVRIFISWPTAIYQATCMLALPFTWVTWYFTYWHLVVIGFLSLIGFLQSSLLVKEYVYFSLQGGRYESQTLSPTKPVRERAKRTRSPLETYELEDGKRILKIAQITDPHLGTFMSKERLHEVSTTIAEWDPDLVFLTGDFTTIESYFEPEKLAYGFSPLKHKFKGRLFACLGNHDYESLETVEEALKETGVVLLKDESAVVETPVGPIQIIGTEYTFNVILAGQKTRNVKEHIHEVHNKFPKQEIPRIWLVHNPEEFMHIPNGSADLVFSGHTHGGQIGLYSLGLNATMYGVVRRHPDHGLWRQGDNLLYVHRGTGFYGFPLRLGVSGELSLLHVTF